MTAVEAAAILNLHRYMGSDGWHAWRGGYGALPWVRSESVPHAHRNTVYLGPEEAAEIAERYVRLASTTAPR